MNSCVICGAPAPATWIIGKLGEEPETVMLCAAHARPLGSTLASARGEDEASIGFTEVLQERVTTLEDLAYRKRIGVV